MSRLTFASVCSGIGAPEVAWRPLGWEPVLMSEIESFPRALLKCRQHGVDAAETGAAGRGVPLWGDFTALRARHFARLGMRVPDLLVGGTPCQAFSVAGRRQGLADPRGNLSLAFVRLADAIDNLRRHCGQPGLVIVWENVPGVLSMPDNAFGCFLAGLAGGDAPLIPPGEGRWTRAGVVAGPRRTVAWRLLDAQYFGLAQRRERVLVVAGPGDWPAAEALFPVAEGLRRDHPPGRGAQAGAAAGVDDAAAGGGDVAIPHVVPTLDANYGRLLGASGQDLGHGHGHLIPFDTTQITSALNRSSPQPGAPCHPLAASAHAPAITFDWQVAGSDRTQIHDRPGVVRALTASKTIAVAFGGNDTRGPVEVAAALDAHGGPAGRLDFESESFVIAHTLRGEGFDGSKDGTGRGIPLVPVASTLTAHWHRSRGQTAGENPGLMNGIVHRSGVRRLTPRECERLQGFPDDYTLISMPKAARHRIEADMAAYYRAALPGLSDEDLARLASDGPRYKGLGNSMAVPMMAWLGRRIDAVERRSGWLRGAA